MVVTLVRIFLIGPIAIQLEVLLFAPLYLKLKIKENLESETNIDQIFILILLIFIINYIF